MFSYNFTSKKSQLLMETYNYANNFILYIGVELEVLICQKDV
jgi:hypothetical protein